MIVINCSSDQQEPALKKLLSLFPQSLRSKVKSTSYKTIEDLGSFKFTGEFEPRDFHILMKALKDKTPDTGFGPDLTQDDTSIEICLPLNKISNWVKES